MNPQIWGKHAWIFLHSVSFGYPNNPTEQDKMNFKFFFNSVANVLPCQVCQHHFKSNLTKHPLNYHALSNRQNLVRWLIDLHNSVNKLTNAKTYTYDEVIKYYDQLYSLKPKFTRTKIAVIFAVIIIIYLIIIWKTNWLKG